MPTARSTNNSTNPPLPALRDEATSAIFAAPQASVRFFLSFFSRGLVTLRPFASQIIPLLICVFLVPLVIFLSVSAGFVVWNNVAVGWEAPIHLQYGDGVLPYAQTLLPKLIPQQPYDISLHLSLPATESNFALGNFMANLTLSTQSNKVLFSIRRPAIVLPPQHSFFHRKKNLVHLVVPMLTSFVAGTSRVVAHVEIGRRDSWTSLGIGQGRELSVASASVRGLVVLRGLRGLVARFPLVFATLSAITFFMILSLILGACVFVARTRRGSQGVDTREEQSSLGAPHLLVSTPNSDGDEKPSKRRRKSRLRRISSGRAEAKTETPTTAIPSADILPDALRQRSLKRFEGLSDSDT